MNLKFKSRYDEQLYLAASARYLQMLKSHQHIELEVNLVVQGTIAYIVDGRDLHFHRERF